MVRFKNENTVMTLLFDGINKGCTMMVHKPSGKIVDVYLREYDGESYIVVGIDWNEEDDTEFYLAAPEELGDILVPYEELNNTLDGLKDTLNDLVNILEDDKKEGE